MGQRTIIKLGVVVNVIEIDDDCFCVTKIEHAAMSQKEAVEYEARLKDWQAIIEAHKKELEAAERNLFMARGISAALKSGASPISNAKEALEKILAADKDIGEKEMAVTVIKERTLPPRPEVRRVKRWFYSDGFVIGPAGGNIGDKWDGSKYIAA